MSAPRLTPASLAATYSLGAHRAIIDAADGHAAEPMLRALAHIGGLAHAAAGYPRHLLSPLRDVLAAVDRLPDAATLAAWTLGELPAGHVEPSPDPEMLALRARAEAAELEVARLQAQLKQAQDDGRLMLVSMDMDMWRRLDAAGRTRLEQELDRSLSDSTEDDGERIPYDELYAYRRLLALGNFFDNPRQASSPVPALPEPEWYTARETDGDEGEDWPEGEADTKEGEE